MHLSCKHCRARLSAELDRVNGDWVIPCFTCGAHNIVATVIQIVGWR